jgi:hypothetical protein
MGERRRHRWRAQGCRRVTSEINFDAQAMISRLGIRADIANYKGVEQAMAAE